MAKPAPGFLHMGVDYVKPGMTEQYYRVIREFRNALAKINHPFGYQVYRVVFGGKQAYVFVWPNDSAEQYYRVNQLPRLVTQAIGPEGAAKMGKEWRECLWKFEMNDRRPRPELSYLPVAAALGPMLAYAGPQPSRLISASNSPGRTVADYQLVSG